MKVIKNKKGFTLIELVIVIIIIAILAAVAIPRFADLADHARDASERATVTAVRQAITIYRADHELRHRPVVFPPQLDSALANSTSGDTNPFFTVIMETGGDIRSGWRKGATIHTYIGPAERTYVYNPVTGAFAP